MSRFPELVVFDWNGTIINDVEESARAMQKVLTALGDDRAWSVELYREHCAVPIRKVYETLGYGHLTNSEIVKINAHWQAAYKQVEHTTKMQKGITETINWLESHNIPKVILSNHMKPSIELHTERLGLHFDDILARVEQHHMITIGKEQLLTDYLEKNNIEPSKVIIIGDTIEEYEIAQNLGLNPVIVTNGSVAEERLSHIPHENRTITDNVLELIRAQTA